MKILKDEYQELSDDFELSYEESGCLCFMGAPCGYCTHEGHPEALENNPDAWIEEAEVESSEVYPTYKPEVW